MAILIRLGLEEGDGREISNRERVVEIVHVILMIRRIGRRSDRGGAGRARMGQVACAGVKLEGLVMLHVIALRQSGDRRNGAAVAVGGPVGIGRREIESPLEPAPGKARGVEQIAHVLSGHFSVK